MLVGVCAFFVVPINPLYDVLIGGAMSDKEINMKNSLSVYNEILSHRCKIKYGVSAS